MKRTDWTFTYTATDLAKAAEAKRTHHEERLTWWKEQKKVITQRVSEAGIEVHESIADRKYSGISNASMGMGPEIRIDATLQRDLMECQGKIQEHSQRVNEYSGWLEVLNGNSSDRLDLDHADFLFFFGK